MFTHFLTILQLNRQGAITEINKSIDAIYTDVCSSIIS